MVLSRVNRTVVETAWIVFELCHTTLGWWVIVGVILHVWSSCVYIRDMVALMLNSSLHKSFCMISVKEDAK